MNTWRSFGRSAAACAVVLGVVAAWARPALADYGARKSEAMEKLDRWEMSDAERRVSREHLEKYFTARETCLGTLVKIAAMTDAGERDDLYVATASTCASTASRIAEDHASALRDIKDGTVGAGTYHFFFWPDELAFLSALAGLKVAEGRDHIVAIRLRLKEMTDLLEKKWKALDDEDRSLDERAKQVTEEVRKELDDVIQQAAEANGSLREKTLEVVKNVSDKEFSTNIDWLDQVLDVVKPVAVIGISMWQAMNTRSAARARTYRTLFTSERRVLVMFEGIRDDVAEFLKENDFSRAKAAYDAAKSSAEAFVGSARTSAQKSDAGELRDKMLAALDAHLDTAEEIYEDFVDENKEKFYGALGSNVTKALVEPDEWNAYARMVMGYDLHSNIVRWQDSATNFFGVDLSPLPPEAREQLKATLRGVIDDLIKEMKAADKTHEDVVKAITDDRKDVAGELD